MDAGVSHLPQISPGVTSEVLLDTDGDLTLPRGCISAILVALPVWVAIGRVAWLVLGR
jgi:hypothetical protein